MPESEQPLEGQIIMLDSILSGRCCSIVDVGAGDGRWGKILKKIVVKVIAIEIWEKYVEKYHLRDIYDEVLVMDVRQFENWKDFDVAILGDVLEHMPRKDALDLIEKLILNVPRTYLTVPITPCPQDGTVYGNPYETHQDQWIHKELEALGWRMLHKGLNPSGLVTIGTYVLMGKN